MQSKFRECLDKIWIFRSLRLQLFLVLVLIGSIPAVLLRAEILESYEDRAISVRILDVQNQFKILADHLITYNYLRDTSSDIINTELDQLSNLYDGRVLVVDKNFKIIKDTYGISEGKTIVSKEVLEAFKGVVSSKYDKKNGYIEITTPIGIAATNSTGILDVVTTSVAPEEIQMAEGVLLTSVSTDTIATTLEILADNSTIFLIITITFLLAVALLVCTVMTSPFARLTRAIKGMKEGFIEEPIAIKDYLETEHVVDAFNQLLGRMQALDRSRQEFVSNVSHELKTPITSMKVLADSLIGQENVPAELYQEFMTDIASEIDRESKIIDDLLAMVRMDRNESKMSISNVDINQFLELLMKRLRPIARKNNVEVTLECERDVLADIDEVKLSLAMTNLIENAIKYNKEGGWVEVKLDADHLYFTVEVSDSGCGIPEEAMHHIYERFYRVDKSHSREIGGTGLGLAIAKNAIMAHKGTIQAESVIGEGSKFIVKIPLKYVE